MEKRKFSKGVLVCGMVLVLIMIGNSPSLAQKDYPNREIELVVPFGGMVDVATRIVCEELAKILGVPVVVVNKPGAGGTIGAYYVSQAKPDGYTLMSGPHSLYNIEPALHTNLPYKTSDFVPIARVVYFPFVVCVKKDAPWKNLEELISHAKKNPGVLKYSSVGIGTGSHLSMAILGVEAGVEFQHIPFKGGPQQVASVLGGHVEFTNAGLTTGLPHLKSGDLRALVANEKIPDLPQVPTMADKGYTEAAIYSWAGFVGPKGTPKYVVDKIASGLEKAVNTPELAKKLNEMGCPVRFAAKEEFGKDIEKETKRMAEVIKKLKIEPR